MEKRIKRVAAMHDMSGFGRCALTVIIPTLSAMGHQVIPLPTALLSTHTGGYEKPYFLDLTDTMDPIIDHWNELGIEFDALYSGFLGNAAQADTMRALIAKFGGKHNITLIDPVMGDDGVLYSTYDSSLVAAVRSLCETADIITPNITEAFFLLEREYIDTLTLPRAEAVALIDNILHSLSRLGAKKTALTGVHLASEEGESGVVTACLDLSVSDKPFFCTQPRIDRNYPGTGDIFASVLLGRLLDGENFVDACGYASTYVHYIIGESAKYSTPEREGVALEPSLCKLMEDRIK